MSEMKFKNLTKAHFRPRRPEGDINRMRINMIQWLEKLIQLTKRRTFKLNKPLHSSLPEATIQNS